MPSSETYNRVVQFVTDELSRVIREGEKETYTREELLQLLAQVSGITRK